MCLSRGFQGFLILGIDRSPMKTSWSRSVGNGPNGSTLCSSRFRSLCRKSIRGNSTSSSMVANEPWNASLASLDLWLGVLTVPTGLAKLAVLMGDNESGVEDQKFSESAGRDPGSDENETISPGSTSISRTSTSMLSAI